MLRKIRAMIFARYKGPDKEGEQFVPGKVYLSYPEIENDDVVILDYIEILDESGKLVKIDPKNGRFEFLDEVYAALLMGYNSKVVGDIVVINGGEKDEKGELFFNIKKEGLYLAKNMTTLDRTNVYPGVVLQDVFDGYWKVVLSVDECLWITVKGNVINKKLDGKFRFAVSRDKELMTVPLLKCVRNEGVDEQLTVGKMYYPIKVDKYGNWLVKNDKNEAKSYLIHRFSMG